MGISAGPDPKVREHLEALVTGGRDTAFMSLAVSVIAICVAGISVYFAYKDSADDAEWRQQQLALLQEISSKLPLAEEVGSKDSPVPSLETSNNSLRSGTPEIGAP